MINIYKNIKKNKISNNNNKIEDILTLDTLINSAVISFYNYSKRRQNIKELLLDLKYNNNIVQKLTVTFSRKNRIYEKDIFAIMTNDMKNNVSNPNITQFFMDCTYYSIPK